MKFIARDQRNLSTPAVSLRRYKRIKGKSIKNFLIDKFLNQYGYDKGIVTANAIVDDILLTVEHYFRFSDNSLLKHGQIVWLAVPIDEYPQKGKSIEQTKLKPVVLDIRSESVV